MAKIPAFHTTSEEYPPTHRNVYHDQSECQYGREIQQRHRIDGEAQAIADLEGDPADHADQNARDRKRPGRARERAGLGPRAAPEWQAGQEREGEPRLVLPAAEITPVPLGHGPMR